MIAQVSAIDDVADAAPEQMRGLRSGCDPRRCAWLCDARWRALIEWAISECEIAKPDGTPLGEAGTFYLLDGSGEVGTHRRTHQASDEDDLWTFAYAIEGDELVQYDEVRTCGREEPRLGRDVELRGLRPLSPAETPTTSAIQSAIDRDLDPRRAAWERHDRIERERLAGFELSLPELRGDERISWSGRSCGLISRLGGRSARIRAARAVRVRWSSPPASPRGRSERACRSWLYRTPIRRRW
jgi:hypothetical protein